MKSAYTEKTRRLALAFPVLQLALILILFISILVVFAGEELSFDPTAKGLKHALDLFAFPVSCVAGLLAVTTLQVAVDQLSESGRQSATAAWSSVQSNFLTYAKGHAEVPLSAFSVNPFAARFREPVFGVGEFTVEYPAPTLTLRRLLDSSSRFDAFDFGLSKELETQLIRLNDAFDTLAELALQGNAKWLAAFVDFATIVRQLRLFLIVQTCRMPTWTCRPVLEEIADLEPKRVCPAYSAYNISGIASDIRAELLCLASALLFSKPGHEHAERVVGFAFRIGLLWANSNERLKSALEMDLHTLWNNSHIVEASPVEL